MYDFDKITERRGVGSLKWDVPERELPMWVADMDFETAPEVTEALKARAAHAIFGYSVITEDWYDAYIRWWKRVADILYRCGACHLQCGEKAYHGRRECIGTDSCVQYLLQLHQK